MKIKKNIIPLSYVMLLCVPLVIHAETPVFTYLYTVISGIDKLFKAILPVLVGVALVVFIWGMVKFIANSGDEKALTEGKQKMIWGVIGLFVIISVWGLVLLLQEISGVGSGPAKIISPAIL